MFRVDPKTVTRWAKQGKLTYICTLGGHRRYLEREVRALLRGAPRPQTERRPQTETSCPTVSIESAGAEHTRMDASVTHGSLVLALRETDGVLVGVCRVDDTHNGSLDTAAAAYAEAHRAVVVEAEAGEAR